MKNIFKFIIISIFLTHCSNNKPQEKIQKMGDELWKEIDLNSWNKTPSISNRIANEEDVKNGVAVFYIENDGLNHKPLNLQLPRLAYLNDSETKKEELVVVIQIEETSKGKIVGYRNIEGGNGVGLIQEFRFLDDNEIEKIIKLKVK